MRETLYIRLRPTSADTETAYCIAAADAARSFVTLQAPLTDILPHAANRHVVLLAPAQDVRLSNIKVPAKQPSKVLQAAPYALEDQLAEDVDTLHFAIGPRQPDGSHPVAIVARARMDEWLAPFRERGIRIAAIVPEMLCLPATEPLLWSALAEPEQITVRTAAYTGFGCAHEDLPMFLEMASGDTKVPMRVVIPRSFSGDLTQLQWPLELLPGFAEPLEALLQHYRPAETINLLQGAYSEEEDVRRLLWPWRFAAILALTAFALAWSTHAIQAFQLGRELHAQEDLNVQRYQQIYPAETRIVDLAAQTDQHLSGQGGQPSDFVVLLAPLADALRATPGLTVQSLQFREGQLFASLGGSDIQQLEILRGKFVSARGVHLDVQSANSGSDGVQIRLKLSPA